jgi:phosphoglycolate phosphatase
VKSFDSIIFDLDGTLWDSAQNRVLPGVAEGLPLLRAKFPLFIVSNCPSGTIESFIAEAGFTGLFKDFECWGNTERPKAENIAAIVARNGLRSPVYFGDTEGDRLAALACGIPYYFAEYGFGRVTKSDARFATFGGLVENLLG